MQTREWKLTGMGLHGMKLQGNVNLMEWKVQGNKSSREQKVQGNERPREKGTIKDSLNVKINSMILS